MKRKNIRPPSSAAQQRRLSFGLAILTCVTFSSMISALPVYLHNLDVPTQWLGIPTASQLMLMVAAQLSLPRLHDRVGSRACLLIGIMLTCLCSIMLAAPSDSLFIITILCALRGAGIGLLLVVGFAQAIDASNGRTDRSQVIGEYGVFSTGPSLVVAPASIALTNHGEFYLVALMACCPILALPSVFRTGLSTFSPVRPLRAEALVSESRRSIGPIAAIACAGVIYGGLTTSMPILAAKIGSLLIFGLLASLILARLATANSPPVLRRVASSGTIAVLGAGGALLALMSPSLPTPWEGIGAMVGVIIAGTVVGAMQWGSANAIFASARSGVSGSALWNAGLDIGTGVGSMGAALVMSAFFTQF